MEENTAIPKLECTSLSELRYNIENSVNCNINDSGAELMGSLQWPNPKSLDLGKLILI